MTFEQYVEFVVAFKNHLDSEQTNEDLVAMLELLLHALYPSVVALDN